MTKAQLKSLIKECLVEILAEGLGRESLNEALVQPRRAAPGVAVTRPDASVAPTKRQLAPIRRAHPSNNVTFGGKSMPASVSKEIISNVTKDAVMASIFEDTAATTLVEQGMSTNPMAPITSNLHDPVVKAVHNYEPEQIFGDEAASKWAALAFDEFTTKRH